MHTSAGGMTDSSVRPWRIYRVVGCAPGKFCARRGRQPSDTGCPEATARMAPSTALRRGDVSCSPMVFHPLLPLR